MIKILALLGLLILSLALTDKQIIQAGLDGLFNANKLPNSTTVVPCIDDATAHKIVAFQGQCFEKAAKGSIKDLIQLIHLIRKFNDQIPQSVKDCLDGNKQLEAFTLKYGIDNNTDLDKLQKKIIEYGTLHFLEVHKWMGSLNDMFKAGKYYQVGYDGAGYLHKVLDMSKDKEVTDSDKQTLQVLAQLFDFLLKPISSKLHLRSSQ